MGRTHQSKSLLSALFSPVEQRLLALLFGQPRRRFQSAELLRLVGGGTGGVHRILTRLTEAELLVVTWIGNQKYYQANPSSPVFAELCSLIAKTAGMVEPLEQALRPLAKNITAAFVYGAVGKRLEMAGAHVEVVVISDSIDSNDLILAFDRAEKRMGRHIIPVVFTIAEWLANREQPDTMVWRIARQPRLYLVGSEEGMRFMTDFATRSR